MALTDRAEIVTWIAQRYGQYLDAVGRPAEDSPEGIGPALDDAERALGIPPIVYPLQEEDSEDMLLQTAYRVMEQVVRDMGPQFFNISTGGDSFSLQQVRLAAEKDLADLKTQVLLVFGSLGAPAGIVTMNLNFLSGQGGRETRG